MIKRGSINVKRSMKMADLIDDNPSLLMLLEHFQVDIVVHDYTLEQICTINNLRIELFLSLCNIYYGILPDSVDHLNKDDIPLIITFLKNSHFYYKEEKYPEIRKLIHEMYDENNSKEVQLIEKFFEEYFSEVIEHLDYEETEAFPAICSILNGEPAKFKDSTSSEYHHHHTDIETKLSELKTLLLKYIPVRNDKFLRRKLLMSLFELEHDLTFHSIIEEELLIPLVKTIEKN